MNTRHKMTDKPVLKTPSTYVYKYHLSIETTTGLPIDHNIDINICLYIHTYVSRNKDHLSTRPPPLGSLSDLYRQVHCNSWQSTHIRTNTYRSIPLRDHPLRDHPHEDYPFLQNQVCWSQINVRFPHTQFSLIRDHLSSQITIHMSLRVVPQKGYIPLHMCCTYIRMYIHTYVPLSQVLVTFA